MFYRKDLKMELGLRLGHNQYHINTAIKFIEKVLSTKQDGSFDRIPELLQRISRIHKNFPRSRDQDELQCPEEILSLDVRENFLNRNIGKELPIARPMTDDQNDEYRLLMDDELHSHSFHDHNIKK